MENVNKFKVFTIAIICTFLFAIAAIYTNTKDVTEEKAGDRTESEYYQEREDFRHENASIDSTNAAIENLNRKVDELSEKVYNNSNNRASSTELKCRIAATLSSRGMEEMSSSAAINDAKVNNNDLVVLCSF